MSPKKKCDICLLPGIEWHRKLRHLVSVSGIGVGWELLVVAHGSSPGQAPCAGCRRPRSARAPRRRPRRRAGPEPEMVPGRRVNAWKLSSGGHRQLSSPSAGERRVRLVAPAVEPGDFPPGGARQGRGLALRLGGPAPSRVHHWPSLSLASPHPINLFANTFKIFQGIEEGHDDHECRVAPGLRAVEWDGGGSPDSSSLV